VLVRSRGPRKGRPLRLRLHGEHARLVAHTLKRLARHMRVKLFFAKILCYVKRWKSTTYAATPRRPA
jgi:hypothetical protein